MKFIKLIMIEQIASEEGSEPKMIDRTIALSHASVEGVVEISPGRCMVFTTTQRQLLVKGDYLEIVGELNSNG
jgi:hypothetical protein